MLNDLCYKKFMNNEELMSYVKGELAKFSMSLSPDKYTERVVTVSSRRFGNVSEVKPWVVIRLRQETDILSRMLDEQFSVNSVEDFIRNMEWVRDWVLNEGNFGRKHI